MNNPKEIIERAKGMLRNLAEQWLNAAVYRTVWSIPLPVVLGIAAAAFILLALFTK